MSLFNWCLMPRLSVYLVAMPSVVYVGPFLHKLLKRRQGVAFHTFIDNNCLLVNAAVIKSFSPWLTR